MFSQTLPIITSPDPILNEVCTECELTDRSLAKLAKQMINTMYKNNGCGLAAPQVGVTKRLVVIDCDQEHWGENPLVLINPEIVETHGELVVDSEGCLSLPGINVPIKRPAWARVQYYDLDGELWELESDGLLGRCLQHEIDHLNGKTMFEACSAQDKIKALKDYEIAREAGAKPGETSVQ